MKNIQELCLLVVEKLIQKNVLYENMTHNMKYDVFLSYSRDDKDIAEKVYNALKGLKVFMDNPDIRGGEDFPTVIAPAIKSSKIFLLLASKNYYNGRYALDELVFAKTHKPRGCIYCYLIDDANIPSNYDFLTSAINRRNISTTPIKPALVDEITELLNDINNNIIVSSYDQDYEKPIEAMLRIETDLKCRMLYHEKQITTVEPGEPIVIRLSKGKHELTFEGIESRADCCCVVYEVKDIVYEGRIKVREYEDYIKVSLLEKYNARKDFEREKYNGHEYVDLGLPSGLKWATCNVGASSPEQYGNYYAWGDISPKEEYNSDNCLSYNNKTLDLDDINGNDLYDVARKSWGSSWRMPTQDEYMELKDNCIWEWVEQDGMKGCRVIGPNGNSIFFPATGFCRGLSIEYEGVEGYYWSSTPNYDSWINDGVESTCSLYFNMYTNGLGYFKDRWFGQAVRPVSDKNFTM